MLCSGAVSMEVTVLKNLRSSEKNAYQVYLSRVHAGMVLLSQVQVQRRVES